MATIKIRDPVHNFVRFDEEEVKLINLDDPHGSLINRLGRERCEQIARLLATGVGDPVLKSIVSAPLDADKQDYLLRDTMFAGVNYGIFDILQLQRSLVRRDIGRQREMLCKTKSSFEFDHA